MQALFSEFGIYFVFLGLFIFILGVSIGSFINAAVFRVKNHESLTNTRSKCRSCEVPIDVKDLIPILSFFILRRRCRKCHSVISWQYPLVEFVTGLLFVIAFFHAETLFVFVRDAIFISYLIILFVYDLRFMLILDRFTIPAMILAVLLNLWLGIVPAWAMLAGALVIAAFFYGQFVISRGTWVGGGDIRMGALMGFMLGLTHGLVALFLAYIIGALVGLGLLLFKKVHRKTQIPFGTFLSVATVIVLFFGQPLIKWYLGFFL